MKHQPTPPDKRRAYLQAQAERLIEEARAWGYVVAIDAHPGPVVHIIQRYEIPRSCATGQACGDPTCKACAEHAEWERKNWG